MEKTTKTTTTNDLLFYSAVAALGVTMTSLCVYGFRKYKEHTQQFYLSEIDLIFPSEDLSHQVFFDDVNKPIEENIYDLN